MLAALVAVELVLGGTASQRTDGHLQALSAERRSAMAWVATNLPPDARVLVLTGGEWSSDADSEWFYELTHRVSAATVQGAEWLGPGAYHEHQVVYQTLQQCADKGAGCVTAFLRLWPADYLYIPKGHLQGPSSPPDCCAAARDGLRSRAGFQLVYDEEGATVFRVDPSRLVAGLRPPG